MTFGAYVSRSRTMACARPAALFGSPASSGRPVAATCARHGRGVVARSRAAGCSPTCPARRGARPVVGEGARALEEQLEVVVVGASSSPCCCRLVETPSPRPAAARRRLVDHVVGEDRRDAVWRPSPGCSRWRTGRRRVPGRPAVAGVDAAGEVLVAEAEGRARLHGRGAAGGVGGRAGGSSASAPAAAATGRSGPRRRGRPLSRVDHAPGQRCDDKRGEGDSPTAPLQGATHEHMHVHS